MNNSSRVAGIAAVTIVAMAGPSFAHAHLQSAVPAVNASVATPPDELELHFSEGLNLHFTGVSLTGPGKHSILAGKAKLKSSDDETLIVPITSKLKAGTYSVFWHALSKDGHQAKGSYSFNVKPQ